MSESACTQAFMMILGRRLFIFCCNFQALGLLGEDLGLILAALGLVTGISQEIMGGFLAACCDHVWHILPLRWLGQEVNGVPLLKISG